MKNKILITLVFAFGMNSFAQAKIETLGDKLMEYGLPCAAALGVSFLFASEDKFAIGAAACAATSAVTYYHRKDYKEMEQKVIANQQEAVAQLKAQIVGGAKDSLVAEIKKEVYEDINQSLLKDKEFISKMLMELKVEFAQYKTVIDQVLAIKLAEFQGNVPKEIESALINGPFLKVLEEKLTLSLSDKQDKIFESQKPKIVEQCVDDALKQIVVRKMGIRSDIEIDN